MRTVSIACLFIASTGAFAQEMTIADLAPENAFFVAGVDDASQSFGAFERTGLYAFMQDPAVSEWMGENVGASMDDLRAFMDSIDADFEDLAHPSGMAGMAAWMVRPDAGATGNDAVPLRMIAGADFGAEAQSMHDMIVNALDAGEEDERLTYAAEAMGDTMVYTVRPIIVEDEGDAWDDDWGDDDWGDDDWGGAGGGFAPNLDAVRAEEYYYARHGQHLMLSTSMDDLENALTRLDGDAFDALADASSYTRLKPAGDSYHAYAMLMNAPLFDLADSAGEEAQGMVQILDASGLSDVRGASITLTFDDDASDTRADIHVHATRLRGVMSLMDVPAESFKAPLFVTPDTAGVRLVQADLSGLLRTVTSIVNDLPPDMAQQAGLFTMQAQMLQPMLDQLGPEIYQVSYYNRPYAPDSEQSLTAIGVKDQQAFNNALQSLLQMFPLPMNARDFQGNQIWTIDAGGMMPGAPDISMGLGFGHFFFGPTAGIEAAMRQAGTGESGLKGDEAFENAMSTLSNEGLAFMYTNMREELAYTQWVQDNIAAVEAWQQRQMGGMGGLEMMLPIPEIPELPDMTKLLEHVSDMVGEFRLADDGIRGTFHLLRAKD